jgi:hypothetical protein
MKVLISALGRNAIGKGALRDCCISGWSSVSEF